MMNQVIKLVVNVANILPFVRTYGPGICDDIIEMMNFKAGEFLRRG